MVLCLLSRVTAGVLFEHTRCQRSWTPRVCSLALGEPVKGILVALDYPADESV